MYNCIGNDNRKAFCLYLFYTTAVCFISILAFTPTIQKMYHMYEGDRIASLPTYILLLSSLFFGLLTAERVKLIYKNKTVSVVLQLLVLAIICSYIFVFHYTIEYNYRSSLFIFFIIPHAWSTFLGLCIFSIYHLAFAMNDWTSLEYFEQYRIPNSDQKLKNLQVLFGNNCFLWFWPG